MREIRLRYGADVLLGTEFVQQLNRIEEFELLNTLGRSDANDAVTVMVRLRLRRTPPSRTSTTSRG